MPYRQRAAIAVMFAAGYLGVMFLLTHVPLGNGPPAGLDKLIHATLFAGLAMVLLAAIQVFRRISLASVMWVALSIILYGALDEWTQQFIPSRTADVWDWLADVTGALLGSMTFVPGTRVLAGGCAAD